jgi:hypothetical protein
MLEVNQFRIHVADQDVVAINIAVGELKFVKLMQYCFAVIQVFDSCVSPVF